MFPLWHPRSPRGPRLRLGSTANGEDGSLSPVSLCAETGNILMPFVERRRIDGGHIFLAIQFTLCQLGFQSNCPGRVRSEVEPLRRDLDRNLTTNSWIAGAGDFPIPPEPISESGPEVQEFCLWQGGLFGFREKSKNREQKPGTLTGFARHVSIDAFSSSKTGERPRFSSPAVLREIINSRAGSQYFTIGKWLNCRIPFIRI